MGEIFVFCFSIALNHYVLFCLDFNFCLLLFCLFFLLVLTLVFVNLYNGLGIFIVIG